MPKQMNEQEWVEVLRTSPERADEFEGWGQMGGFNIARILSAQPQLARYCDLKKLKPMAWIRLLRKQPQFAPQCDKWEEMRKFEPGLVKRLQNA